MCRSGRPIAPISRPLDEMITQVGYDDFDTIQPKNHTKRKISSGTASTNSDSSSSIASVAATLYPSFITGSYKNINDCYDVLPRILGNGHYGSVRECIHRASGNAYAVKSIEKESFQSTDQLRREVALLSSINHSSIMKMVDVCEDFHYVHIVTEKYNGGELFDKIVESTADDHCMSEAEAARITLSLLKAVEYLHSNDIVHRDIKPENVLFAHSEKPSEIKLIDFGLSRKHVRGEPMMTSPVGTAYYMSPETLRKCYDRSCDIWSIGVVAYVMLCGYPPFNGNSDGEIFDAIKGGYYTFPSDRWSGISQEAKDFIQCLLQVNPQWRPSAEGALKHPWFSSVCV